MPLPTVPGISQIDKFQASGEKFASEFLNLRYQPWAPSATGASHTATLLYCHLCEFNRRAYAHTQEYQQRTLTLQTFFRRKKGLLFSVVTFVTLTEERIHTHKSTSNEPLLQTFLDFVCSSTSRPTSFNTACCRMLYYIPYDVDLGGCWEVFSLVCGGQDTEK
jgi:hypothetical protein